MTRAALLALLLFVLTSSAAAARGSDHGGGGGRHEVRVTGECAAGANATLRLRADDAGVEVGFRLRETLGRGVWRMTIVQENRVAFRASAGTTRSDDSFELQRTLRDLPGSDTVTVRAWGPKGLGCRATATLPADA